MPSTRPRYPRRLPLLSGWLAAMALAAVGQAEAAGIDLAQAVEHLEQAFQAGEARRLRAILPGKGRLHLSIPSLSPRAGYFSADQAVYFLDDLFRRHPVVEFTARQEEHDGSGRVFVRGRLTVRTREAKRRILNLHFLLIREEDRWVLREIREHARE
ncbi:MAG: DUF4783 domain-containing protein [Acidobacteriota bacterium]